MLTKIEQELIDKTIIDNIHLYKTVDEAVFIHAMCTVLPYWRVEQILGQDRMTKQVQTSAYVEYIKNLIDFNSTK